MIRTVLTHPNKTLRQRSREVLDIDDGLRSVVDDLVETVKSIDRCSGLSAVQLGHRQRVIVFKATDGRILTFVNPVIVKATGLLEARETCESMPGRWVTTWRSSCLIVEHLSLLTKEKERITVSAPQLAVAFQHEIDHLNGVLITERLPRPERLPN